MSIGWHPSTPHPTFHTFFGTQLILNPTFYTGVQSPGFIILKLRRGESIFKMFSITVVSRGVQESVSVARYSQRHVLRGSLGFRRGLLRPILSHHVVNKLKSSHQHQQRLASTTCSLCQKLNLAHESSALFTIADVNVSSYSLLNKLSPELNGS